MYMCVHIYKNFKWAIILAYLNILNDALLNISPDNEGNYIIRGPTKTVT